MGKKEKQEFRSQRKPPLCDRQRDQIERARVNQPFDSPGHVILQYCQTGL